MNHIGLSIPRSALPPAGRFAPAPTGDLHAGHLLTAGLAWASARRRGMRFILRLEDLDAPRVLPGSAEKILATLARAGLDWDEDWVRGGPCVYYRQSERTAHYHAALEQLRAVNRVYPCACSRAEISLSAPHGPEGPVYPGVCRERDPVEILARCAELNRLPAWRFRVRPGTVEFTDGARGLQSDEPEKSTGDFVLARGAPQGHFVRASERAGGAPQGYFVRASERTGGDNFSYQLAVVVDDAAMGITEVLRGGDLLGSTARQLMLYEALGLPAPEFMHGPLLVNGAGVKLSKRDQALAADALLDRRGTDIWRDLGEALLPGQTLPGGRDALFALIERLPRLPVTARLPG